MWKWKTEGNKIAFPTLNLLLEDENVEFCEVKYDIVKHLEEVTLDFDRYIPEDVIKYSWELGLFGTDDEDLADEISSTAGLQEQLAEIQSDETLHYNNKKQTKSLSAFWIKVKKEEPLLGNKAVKGLLPFSTIYLCETQKLSFEADCNQRMT